MAEATDVTDPEKKEPFDAEKSIAYLRAHGVEVETHEERVAKAAAVAAVAAAPPASSASQADDGLTPFTYVKIPSEGTSPVVELKATRPASGGDVLPTVLAPAFASDGAMDQETVARETASRMKGMVVGGSETVNGKPIEAPSADALQGLARSGVVEAWPLAPADDANGRKAVRFYIDEVGALRNRPRNARAEALAAAVGLGSVSIHGDAYVGRCGFVGLEGRGEANMDFPLADMAHDATWVGEARRANTARAGAANLGDDEHLASGGDGEGGLYKWTQTDEELEVRVLRGIPEGKLAKKRIAVSYGKGGDGLRVCVDKAEVFRVEKLFSRVTPDECSWSVEGGGGVKGAADGFGGVLVISMEKGEARPWADLILPGTAMPGLTL
jgi:hypothetical protein